MRFILAIFAFLLLAPLAPAEACTTPCTKAQVTTDINTNWPDNTTGSITPALLRSTVLELVNSYVDVNGASSFTCSTHQFLTAIATLSSYTCAQPAVGDVSGFGTGVATALGTNTNATGGFPTVPVGVAQGGTGDTGTAWTTFTPSFSCGTATFTVNGARWKNQGKITWIQIDFTIASVGTCANTISFTAPNTANFGSAIAGREDVINGKGFACSINAGSASFSCAKADTSQIVVNENFHASGVYENQ